MEEPHLAGESAVNHPKRTKRSKRGRQSDTAAAVDLDNIVQDPDADDHTSVDEVGWTVDEIESLLKNLQNHLPKKDMVPYDKRLKKMKWDEVAVEGKDADQCRSLWETALSKLRTFRAMGEIVNEAQLLIRSQLDGSVKAPVLPRTRKRKEKKHPDYPKRPLNPYMFFRIQKMPHLKIKHPKWSLKQLSDRISEKFNNLPEDKKAVLEKLSEEDRGRYRAARMKFEKDHPECLKKLRREKKSAFGFRKKDVLPKAPLSPFELFSQERRKKKKGNEEDPSDVMAEWESLSDEERRPFIETVLEDEERYKAEIAVFKEKNPRIRVPKFRSSVKFFDRRKFSSVFSEKNSSLRPLRPAVAHNPFKLFCSEFLIDLVGKREGEGGGGRGGVEGIRGGGSRWLLEASLAWRGLSRTDKTSYEQRINEMWAPYYVEAAKYLDSLPENMRERERKTMGIKKHFRKEAENNLTQNEDVSFGETSSESEGVFNDESRPVLQTKMNGLNLFIYENERDFRCCLPHLDNKKVRDHLCRMFEELPSEEQADLEERARHFEDDFF